MPICGVARQPRYFKTEHDPHAPETNFGHQALKAFPVSRAGAGLPEIAVDDGDPQWTWRENQALARRLHAAKLRGASVEDINYRTSRGLDKSVIRSLTQQPTRAANHENILVLGPTGVGKSFVACALAQKACRDGFSALYPRAAALFWDLAIARADGSLRSLLTRLSRIDMLVIDDWAMAPLAETERRDFWEICEDRYQTRSTILIRNCRSPAGTNRSAIPPLLTESWTGWFTTPIASKCVETRCAKSARARNRRANARQVSVCRGGEKGCCPFPRTPFSASGVFLRYAPDSFFLTKPNASGTIEMPASLRSENCSPSARNAVRVPFGMSVHLRRNPHTEKQDKYASRLRSPLWRWLPGGRSEARVSTWTAGCFN
jgi:DNA replication protein DnaC